jgi:hypothetical protein
VVAVPLALIDISLSPIVHQSSQKTITETFFVFCFPNSRGVGRTIHQRGFTPSITIPGRTASVTHLCQQD